MYYKEDFLSLSLWSWWLLWVSLIYPQRLKKKERRESSQGSLENLIKHSILLIFLCIGRTENLLFLQRLNVFWLSLIKKRDWLRRIYNFSNVLAYHQLKNKLLKYAKIFLSPSHKVFEDMSSTHRMCLGFSPAIRTFHKMRIWRVLCPFL